MLFCKGEEAQRPLQGRQGQNGGQTPTRVTLGRWGPRGRVKARGWAPVRGRWATSRDSVHQCLCQQASSLELWWRPETPGRGAVSPRNMVQEPETTSEGFPTRFPTQFPTLQECQGESDPSTPRLDALGPEPRPLSPPQPCLSRGRRPTLDVQQQTLGWGHSGPQALLTLEALRNPPGGLHLVRPQ